MPTLPRLNLVEDDWISLHGFATKLCESDNTTRESFHVIA
jgi:hypothetical protein